MINPLPVLTEAYKHIYERRSKRKKLRNDLYRIRMRLRSCFENEVHVLLAELRDLLLTDEKLMEISEVNHFYHAWLKDPTLALTKFSLVGGWPSEKRYRMLTDLEKITF